MENPFINYWLWYYDVLWRYWPIVVLLTIIAVWLMYRRFAKREPILPDLQSGGNEYKDLQSDNGIANADTQHDGISNTVERLTNFTNYTN